MNDVNRAYIQVDRPEDKHSHFSLAITIALVCCGGPSRTHKTVDAGTPADTSLGSGGAERQASGVGGFYLGVGGFTSPSGVGGAGGGSTGDAVSQGEVNGHWEDGIDGGTVCSVDSSCDCDGPLLWNEIANGFVGLGYCTPLQDGGTWSGEIVFDGDGLIIDNTWITDAATRQYWLSKMANHRWPCMAGQVLPFTCTYAD